MSVFVQVRNRSSGMGTWQRDIFLAFLGFSGDIFSLNSSCMPKTVWRVSITVKKGYRFSVPSRDVTNQTLPGRE
jgi:hypothetical protein